MEDGISDVLFRDEQCAQLEIAIGAAQSNAHFPAVLVVGSESSGRLHSTLSVLRRNSKRFIVVDADLIHNERNFFEHLLFHAHKLLRGGNDKEADDISLPSKLNCARTHEFAKQIDALLTESQMDETLFIVLRNADRLVTRLPTSALRSLLRINETFAALDKSKNNSCIDSNKNSKLNGSKSTNVGTWLDTVRTRICSIFIVSHASVSGPSESCCALRDNAFNIRFSAYTKDELVQILRRRVHDVTRLLRECCRLGLLSFDDPKSRLDVEAQCVALARKAQCVPIDSYVELVVQTFLPVCRNVDALHRLVLAHFPRFIEPTLSNANHVFDIRSSWKRLEPIIKRSLRSAAFQTLVCEANAFASLKVHVNTLATSTVSTMLDSTPTSTAQHNELSLSVMDTFLVISAYLATHTDASHFIKERVRRSSKAAKPTKVNEYDTASHARAFPLHRLASIFRHIFDPRCVVMPKLDHVTETPMDVDDELRKGETERFGDHVASHVQTLVQLGLLSPVNREQIDVAVPRFRLMLDIDVIRSLSRSVHFDLAKYLPDG